MQLKNKMLLDTSALLALLKKEPGHEIVSNIIGSSAFLMGIDSKGRKV